MVFPRLILISAFWGTTQKARLSKMQNTIFVYDHTNYLPGKERMMPHIEKKADVSELTIALPWRLDATTAPKLEATINQSLDGVTVLNIDAKALEYISSAGLRVLLSAQKIMNKHGEMKVTHVSASVMEIFKVTGFSEILNIS